MCEKEMLMRRSRSATQPLEFWAYEPTEKKPLSISQDNMEGCSQRLAVLQLISVLPFIMVNIMVCFYEELKKEGFWWFLMLKQCMFTECPCIVSLKTLSS